MTGAVFYNFPLLIIFSVSTITTVQPMMPTTNTVVIQQQQRKPENYMVMAVLVTFFCNCPLGTLAWIFSCLSDGSYNEGLGEASLTSSKIGLTIDQLTYDR